MAILKRFQLPPIPAILLAILSVQGGAAIAKYLFPFIGPAGTASVRSGFSAIILLLLFRPRLSGLTRDQWKAVIPYGLSLGAMNLVFYYALERIPLGLAVTLEFVGPLLLAVSGSRRILDLLWVLLAGAGIALIAPWKGSTAIDPLGMFLALLAGGFWALYIVMGGRASRMLPGGEGVATGMIFATLITLPFGFLTGGLTQLTGSMLVPAISLAILSSALPFTLELTALRHLSARTFSILMSLEPAVATLCGMLFLREHLSLVQWLAVALVVIASGGATLSAKRARPAES
ncbi:MAG: DMT family transporter [Candidatus Pseudobacter hemicellulosilyticus]|uniref:DMT family transporter n=1 Tax=Candidatus Pseudobacter hemicellulosilyticus TaxID=3121375 RepID=A0AAJ6BHQ0_9BACT|nr:MAG: DMT family transporter [Pseudobacter sp.]